MLARIKRNKSRRGQGLTEYVIIVGLIAIACVAAVQTFGGTLNEAYTNTNTAFAPVNEAISGTGS